MLPALTPDPNILVDVQQTSFSHDVLGRWVCSTWPEGFETCWSVEYL
jgi:hypothetical protein